MLELASIPLSVKSPITLAEEYKKHILITFMQHAKSFNKGQLTGNQVVGVQVRRKNIDEQISARTPIKFASVQVEIPNLIESNPIT